jgi:flavin-dependent dehydrogenase
MKSTDAIVIGGGPAGMAAALGLVEFGIEVTVLERMSSPSVRIGETLPPEAATLLRRLGVWERFLSERHLPAPGTISVWETDEPNEQDFIFNPYGNGWHLDRTRFDSMLVDEGRRRGIAVEAGSQVVRCSHSTNNGWHVEVRSKGIVSHMEATWIIDATGRSSWMARQKEIRRHVCDQLVGIFRFWHRDRTSGLPDPRLLVEAVEQGWWYAAPLPEGRIAVAYMTDLNLLPPPPRELTRFWDLKARETRHVERFLSNAVTCSPIASIVADSYCLEQVGGHNWLAVGDAAMAWDPLSSQGLTNALRTGILAAHTIVEAHRERTSDLSRYEATIAQDFKEYQRLRLHFYGRARRWPQSPFWKRRQMTRLD